MNALREGRYCLCHDQVLRAVVKVINLGTDHSSKQHPVRDSCPAGGHLVTAKFWDAALIPKNPQQVFLLD